MNTETWSNNVDAIVAVTGSGSGKMLILSEPLSFWGGYDSQNGVIVDPKHPQLGIHLSGSVMFMERAKGSSSSSSVLAEAIRNGTGPSAIVMRERDLIVGLGCIVASELYGINVPVVIVDESIWNVFTAAANTGHFDVVVEAPRNGPGLLKMEQRNPG